MKIYLQQDSKEMTRTLDYKIKSEKFKGEPNWHYLY